MKIKKWKAILCSCIGRIKIVTMTILRKAIVKWTEDIMELEKLSEVMQMKNTRLLSYVFSVSRNIAAIL